MASGRLKKTDREICESKTPYLTKDEAKRGKRLVHKRRGQNLSVYPCPVCKCWHLTSQIEAD